MSAATALMATSAMAVIGRIWPRSPWRLLARAGAKLRRWAVMPRLAAARPVPTGASQPISGAPRRCDAEVAGRCKDVGRAAMRLAALAIGALVAGAVGGESRSGP